MQKAVKFQLTHDTKRVKNHGHIQVAAGQIDNEDGFHILEISLRGYGNQNKNVSTRADDWGDDETGDQDDV